MAILQKSKARERFEDADEKMPDAPQIEPDPEAPKPGFVIVDHEISPSQARNLDPYDKGLLGTTLHYPYEVRNSQDYFADIPELTPAPDLLRLAAQILDSKLRSFDPSGWSGQGRTCSSVCRLARARSRPTGHQEHQERDHARGDEDGGCTPPPKPQERLDALGCCAACLCETGPPLPCQPPQAWAGRQAPPVAAAGFIGSHIARHLARVVRPPLSLAGSPCSSRSCSMSPPGPRPRGAR
jgi:hypothetical protein